MQLGIPVAKPILVTLRGDVAPELVEALRRLPDVGVHLGAPNSTIITADQVLPITPVLATATELEELVAERPENGAWLALVKAALDDRTAARLEDAGVGYVDAANRAWLPGQSSTPTARPVGAGRARGLRAGGLRLAQLLADYPDEQWSERELARRGASSPVTAHHLLRQLEADWLIVRTGSGTRPGRRVRDAAALRRWLAVNGRPDRVDILNCFVSGPEALSSHANGHRLALTGARAAARIGLPVLTSRPQYLYRVDAEGDEFERVPSEIGGFRTDRGANVALISDPGRLALTDARRLGRGLVAPPSRVMLDLFLEPRGDAAVDAFLDLWGSRTDLPGTDFTVDDD